MKRAGNVLLVPLGLAALVSCAVEEPKPDPKYAGTYEYEMTGPELTMTKTLTLRQDGTATMSAEGKMGEAPISGTLTGTYMVNGATLTARFRGPDGGPYQFRIAGDTLFGQATPTEIAMGNTAGITTTEQPLVRVP